MTDEKVQQLLRMSIRSLADVQYLEKALSIEIEKAEQEQRWKDSIALKRKLLEVRQARGLGNVP